MTHWSWIFEQPLPCLRRLKIHFLAEWEDGPLSNLVVLELPTDLRLRVLDLYSAILPWSSDLFIELKELHLDFSNSDTFVEISEDELLGIFDASPQSERLSLASLTLRIPTVDDQRQYPPTRMVQLSSLTFLKLANAPWFIGYILDCMDTPQLLPSRSIHCFPPGMQSDVSTSSFPVIASQIGSSLSPQYSKFGPPVVM